MQPVENKVNKVLDRGGGSVVYSLQGSRLTNLDLNNILQVIQLIVIVFWAGYTYRLIRSSHENIKVLFKRQDKMGEYLTALDKVQTSDLSVLNIKLNNAIEYHSNIEKRLDLLASKLDSLS